MKNATQKKRIAARDLQLTTPCEITFQADPPKDKPDHHPFTGVGYTGAEVPSMVFGKFIVDLASAKVNPRTAILYAHDHDARIGHTEQVRITDKLELSGVLYSQDQQAARVIEDSKRGFPWQMSVGIHSAAIERVPKGYSVTVNGRKLEGPGAVGRWGR